MIVMVRVRANGCAAWLCVWSYCVDMADCQHGFSDYHV